MSDKKYRQVEKLGHLGEAVGQWDECGSSVYVLKVLKIVI